LTTFITSAAGVSSSTHSPLEPSAGILPNINGQSQNSQQTSASKSTDPSNGLITFSNSPAMIVIAACIGVFILVISCYGIRRYKLTGCCKLTKRGRRSVRRISCHPPTEIVVNR
jgi:hypothetical protein